eukprot:373371_1
MAQLFNIYFPRYYFDLQNEFELEFMFPLPFTYVVEDGRCYVSMVYYDQDNKGDLYYWQKKGLQSGLRIMAVNNKSLIDDYNIEDEDGHINPDTILDEYTIEDLLAIADTELLTLKFKEEMHRDDYSIPIGLGYKQEEKTFSPNRVSHINDEQIGASSFERGYEPSQCRFNNPNSFWQPSGDNQSILDTWLRIDVGNKIITKLFLQGSPDHLSYVKSFWIDYSDDCCQWKSHPLGEIKCKYKNHNVQGLSDKSLHLGLNEDKEPNMIATIIIWPAIKSRFIRIRPYTILNKVAIRLELYGFTDINIRFLNLPIARVVTLDDVNEFDKLKLMERVTNLPSNAQVIQINCKQVISEALDRGGVTAVSFTSSDKDINYVCEFATSGTYQTERAMGALSGVGIGRDIGIISTTAIAHHAAPIEKSKARPITKREPSKFNESIKSRQVVQVVIDNVMNSSLFTFDYLCMLMGATIFVAVGLAGDNALIMVAGTSLSPIMGPVLAFTFGVTLGDSNMIKLGLKNELLSVLISILVGFIIAFLYAIFSENDGNWPTEQMISISTVGALADFGIIATISGLAVSLSILEASNLNGIAVSVTLLPPTVNCGMLLAFALFALLFPQHIPIDKNYRSKQQLLTMSGWSLLLSIESVIIIFIVSRLMFYIKNVYIQKDRHEKIWKSLTYVRQSYGVKMRPVQFAMDNDFAATSGTLKGGVLRLTRQKSLKNNYSTQTTLQIPNNGKKQKISSSTIGQPKTTSPNSSDSDESDDSEQQEIDNKKKYVAINEFTPDEMANMKTPIGPHQTKNMDFSHYDKVMED